MGASISAKPVAARQRRPHLGVTQREEALLKGRRTITQRPPPGREARREPGGRRSRADGRGSTHRRCVTAQRACAVSTSPRDDRDERRGRRQVPHPLHGPLGPTPVGAQVLPLVGEDRHEEERGRRPCGRGRAHWFGTEKGSRERASPLTVSKASQARVRATKRRPHSCSRSAPVGSGKASPCADGLMALSNEGPARCGVAQRLSKFGSRSGEGSGRWAEAALLPAVGATGRLRRRASDRLRSMAPMIGGPARLAFLRGHKLQRLQGASMTTVIGGRGSPAPSSAR